MRHPDPLVLLESPRLFTPTWTDLPEPSAAPLPFGVAGLARPGDDLTLVGIGNTVIESMLAARRLAEHGVQARVVDLRTAAPLDRDGVAAMVVPDRPVILVGEQPRAGSVLTDLAYHLVRTGAARPEHVELLTGAPVPAPVSPALLDGLLADADRIVRAALDTSAPSPRGDDHEQRVRGLARPHADGPAPAGERPRPVPGQRCRQPPAGRRRTALPGRPLVDVERHAGLLPAIR
ncbi:transketolase C-terminal domain-containing protein [Micromonospora craniellae]|uniref:transketolase C-terminal domain-containing protein n=1 Tax=Micromonospora craniellae TaxID=2294034 RepID=UPI0013148663|nr:transketolase C-terminal domain-containing protein [Micromonospora craniellae]QOC93342.1 hypothetical protein ID554_06615 [Micromonospora craniellae]